MARSPKGSASNSTEMGAESQIWLPYMQVGHTPGGYRTSGIDSRVRQRRVKCDEGRPNCRNCERLGRHCVGYATENGNEKNLVVQQTLIRRASEACSLPSRLLCAPQLEGSKDVSDLLYLIPRINSKMSTTSDSVQKSMRSLTAIYLIHLPCRFGHNTTLDAAVTCVAAASRKLWAQCSGIDLETPETRKSMYLHRTDTNILPLYLKALKLLQQSLADPAQSVIPETMCSAAMLCCFEVRF